MCQSKIVYDTNHYEYYIHVSHEWWACVWFSPLISNAFPGHYQAIGNDHLNGKDNVFYPNEPRHRILSRIYIRDCRSIKYCINIFVQEYL